MATENLKQRVKDDDRRDQSDTAATVDKDSDKGAQRNKKMKMAKRGLRSLSIAVALPLALTAFDIYFFGAGVRNIRPEKSIGLLSLLVLHAACMASTFLMGLSAWLVWAEGGFHRKPAALYLYLTQLGLSLAWDPIVCRLGAQWVGLILCVAMFGALVGCYRVFKGVNAIAGDLVKPCMARAALVAFVNLKLAFS